MAKIRINPEETLVEVTLPEGDVIVLDELDEEGVCSALGDFELLCSEKGTAYLVVAGESADGLEANSLYKLTKVSATLEEGADIGESEDDEEEEEK